MSDAVEGKRRVCKSRVEDTDSLVLADAVVKVAAAARRGAAVDRRALHHALTCAYELGRRGATPDLVLDLIDPLRENA